MNASQKKSFILFFIFILIFFGLRYSGLFDGITLASTQAQAQQLRAFVHEHYFLSVIFFITFYVVIAAFALPFASLTTVTGGYLFGTLLGAIYTNVGATIGAVMAFLLVRYSIGDVIKERYALMYNRFNKRFQKQGVQFLLAARLIVLFPYFMVNMLAGLTNVDLWTFMWTTSLGIFPASLVFTYTGQQLLQIKSIQDVFTLPMIIAFVALGLMLFIPRLVLQFIKKMNGTA